MKVQPPAPVNVTEVFKGPLGCILGPASPLLEKAGSSVTASAG